MLLLLFVVVVCLLLFLVVFLGGAFSSDSNFCEYITIGETRCKKNARKCQPSKHAGSDLEVFWLQLVMAIMASVQPEMDWIVYAGSDFPHLFQFRQFS